MYAQLEQSVLHGTNGDTFYRMVPKIQVRRLVLHVFVRKKGTQCKEKIINGVKIGALIDTGSDYNLWSYQVVEHQENIFHKNTNHRDRIV